MMCERCGKRPATTYVKRTINGQTTEWHLCAECAAAEGVGLFGGFGFGVGDLFGGFLTQPALRSAGDAVRCATCGKSFRDIAESGQVGCPDCYTTFYEQLRPSVQRIHGKTVHAGKTALTGTKESRIKEEIEKLKKELQEAIERQDYETCAVLRDKIKELEDGRHDG
ncbi:MAG: UvrB/UvrC motif-containing protein [Clostridia bacterium]|nr:UvrB/UvrC motif-containing protein [Clostridia bacterium]